MVKSPSTSQNQKASKAPQDAKNGKTTTRSERKKAPKHKKNLLILTRPCQPKPRR